MPKIVEPTTDDTCFYCGRQAHWVSINSKRKRCEEKNSKCPAIIEKAQRSRDANITPEQRKEHMLRMSRNGIIKLKQLYSDPEWLEIQSNKISKAVRERGGHVGANNPMFGKTHRETTKEKQSNKAQNRNPECYVNATKTKIKKGIAIPKHLKNDFELYEEKVDNFTYASWKYHQDKINPNNLPRGSEYELDHKFSKHAGFVNNIPPEIIGHYANLELIPKIENRSKKTKCSITEEELYEAVKNSYLGNSLP
jgi:hypothetical protein